MPTLEFRENEIYVLLPGGHDFLSEFDEDETIDVEYKEYPNGKYQGHLRSNNLFVTFDHDEKVIDFVTENTTFRLQLTDFQATKVREYFENGEYYPTEFPEQPITHMNTDPREPDTNGNNPEPLNIGLRMENTISNEAPRNRIGGRRKTRTKRNYRQKLKARKSIRRTRVNRI